MPRMRLCSQEEISMSEKYYQKVKEWYESGLWSEARVRQAVTKKWITKAEYKKITGEDYA